MARPAMGYLNKAGQKVPGSTTVLKSVSTMDTDVLCAWAARLAREGKDWRSERRNAGEHGTALHELCETKLPHPLTDADRPLTVSNLAVPGTLSAWGKLKLSYEEIRKWYVQHEPKIIYAEEALISEAFQFAGTPDCVWTFARGLEEYGVKPGEAVLGDYKTGGMVGAKEVAQMSSYRVLLKENGIADVVGAILLHAPTKQAGFMRPVWLSPEILDIGWDVFQCGLRIGERLPKLAKACA